MITIFKNIKETTTPFHKTIDFVIDRIKSGASKDLVDKIRAEQDKDKRKVLKKDLPAICFSGVFTKRNDQAIIQHSGFICLDFDGYQSKSALNKDLKVITQSEYTYCAFISPSGDGIKVIVKVPPSIDSHKGYFQTLMKHYDNPHFDKATGNISRVCYESYDPSVYVNENSSVWDKIEEEEIVQHAITEASRTIPITDEDKIIKILLTWWGKKYPMVNGSRNHNLYILSMAFNDFGVDKSSALNICLSYASSDFKQIEIIRLVDSAYSNVQNFGTKYYEDRDKIESIKGQLKAGVPKKVIRGQLDKQGVDPDAVDSIIQGIAQDEDIFWKKTEKGGIKMFHIGFKKFLEDNGFYKYFPHGSQNYIFVRITNNLIENASEQKIKDFTLNHLLSYGDIEVYNFFVENTKYFTDTFLSFLTTIDVYVMEDTKEHAYLYYRNCAVRVSEYEVMCIDYFDLNGYVWKEHIIDRDFRFVEGGACDFKRFVENICNKEESRVKSMESTIGFLLHGYKNLSFCPAVILNDEVITDNPEGGTGKGLLMNGISKMKKVIMIDGKSFTFERSFAYQLVSAETQVICFDDVRKHFDFERLFSAVTEGLTIEKKNKDAIKIPFAKSPKIAITTNYAIKGAGNSFARRKWELELHQYYTKEFTPLDEFGRLMFSDWDEAEWLAFDNYMLQNLSAYLSTGLVKSSFVNLRVRQFSAETSHEFMEWCAVLPGQQPNEVLTEGMRLYKNSLYDDFIRENPDYAPKSKFTISRTRFYRWLSSYSQFKYECPPLEGRDMSGRWIIFGKEDADSNPF
jgi:hypothetical protein